MGRQGPHGPRTPAEGCEHSKVDTFGIRLYSVLKVSVPGIPGSRTVFFEVIETPHWAYSSVGLEHTPDKREVGSSNLPRPTT